MNKLERDERNGNTAQYLWHNKQFNHLNNEKGNSCGSYAGIEVKTTYIKGGETLTQLFKFSLFFL